MRSDELETYDVAISLLGEDELYARQLEEEVSKVVRGPTFLYSRRQGELAIAGEMVETFYSVFRERSRVVLILFRPGWGDTGYTSVEHDAIKARRAQSADLRWVVVVSLGGPPHAPVWYDAKFRVTPELFSPEAIAAVVAARVSDAGGDIGPESPIERARRLQVKQLRLEEIANRLNREGPQRLADEATLFFDSLRGHAEEINRQEDISDRLEHQQRDRACVVNYRDASLLSFWGRRYANSLDGATLILRFVPARSQLRGIRVGGEIRPLLEVTFGIYLDDMDLWGWKVAKAPRTFGEREFFTTDQLAEWAISRLLEAGHADHSGRRGGWLL